MLKITQTHLSIILFLSTGLPAQNVAFLNYDGFNSIGTQINRTASITLFDVDKDGDLDALIANGRHWAEQNYIFYNNGHGAFKTAQPIGAFWDASYAICVGDFDKDGLNDIAVANDNSPNKIYWGSEQQAFIRVSEFGNSSAPSRNLSVADIDQDGDVDLIISNRNAVNEICLNDGKGNFQDVLLFGEKNSQTLETETVDINKDGFLDIELGEDSHSDTYAITIGDLNNDELPDIVASNSGELNLFYITKKK